MPIPWGVAVRARYNVAGGCVNPSPNRGGFSRRGRSNAASIRYSEPMPRSYVDDRLSVVGRVHSELETHR